jgi:hypothetical protein
MTTLKWTAEDMAILDGGKFPVNAESIETAVFGDIEKGFKEADLIVERDMHQQTTSHQPLESRSCMAYWQNGKCYMHVSTQSLARTVASVAGWVGVKPEELVLISEYPGGGSARLAQSMAIPALMSKSSMAPSHDARVTREGLSTCAPYRAGGLQEGRSRHRDRHLHRRIERTVSPPGRSLDDGEPWFTVVPGAEHALPRHFGRDQHAAGRVAARTGRPAGVCMVRAADS